ncbi:tetratricopeptide repeat protein [Sneathiella sp.]|uniref:tetratricopeptide repeat protein n=1 Tax=Sneathiella sp. TaxID=1964365 RepID=UPI002FE20CD4
MIRGILAILLLTGFLLAGSAAHARQDDPRLDELFSQLAKAESAEEAKLLEQEIWRIWLTSGSDTVDFLMVQGMSYMEHGDLARALTLFSTVVRIDPGYSEGWNKRATLLFFIGEYDSSMEDIARVLELEPRHFGALSGLGRIFELREREAGALSAYEKALALHPHMQGVKARVDQLILERNKKRI